MAEIARIIAPTDFSPAADRASDRAALLASQQRAALHLLHVLPPKEVLARLFPDARQGEAEAFRAHAERSLRERAQRISDRFGVTPTCELLHGRAHPTIMQAIDSIGASAVVLGAQGERAGALRAQTVGDTALKLAESSPVATVLVRREAQEQYCRVLACAKGAPADRHVIDWANRLSPDDLFHVVSAYQVPYARRLTEWGASQATIDVYAAHERDARTRQLGDLLSELGLPAARARLHIERGDALQAILRNAATWEADLLVVSKRARTDSLAPGPFGSVARHVAFLAPMDVVIIPPGKAYARA